MSTQNTIESKLQQAFTPQFLQVDNESHQHNVPSNSETHFKVTLVSESFIDKRPVQRHQQVYGCLQAELAGCVHALALHTYAPKEWEAANVPESPRCLGGSKADDRLDK